eukprot:SAG22_NODE_463_length_10196_cov_4.491928_5_plen_86_part_00
MAAAPTHTWIAPAARPAYRHGAPWVLTREVVFADPLVRLGVRAAETVSDIAAGPPGVRAGQTSSRHAQRNDASTHTPQSNSRPPC